MSITKQLVKSGADLFVPKDIENLLDYNLIYNRLGNRHNLRHVKVPSRRKKILFACNLKVFYLDQTKVPGKYICKLCKKEKSKKKPKIGKTFEYESKHIITFHKNFVCVEELISNIQYLEWRSLSLQGFDFSLLAKRIKN